MAFKLADRVRETSTTAGTAAFALAGAVSGYRTFASQLADADTCFYSAVLGSDFESGLGTYTASGNTLARTTIFESSNAGAAVNFAAGAKTIFVTLPAKAFATLAQVLAGTPGRPINADILGQAGIPIPVTFASSIALDLTAGVDFEIGSLTANLTLANPAVIKPGWSGTILLPQDATGGRTVSYGSMWKFAGGTPTASTAANAVDMVVGKLNRAGTLIRATLLKDFK